MNGKDKQAPHGSRHKIEVSQRLPKEALGYRDDDRRTLLHQVVANGQKAEAELLLRKGADIDAMDKYGQTPLHYAAAQGSKELVELLIRRGADHRLLDCNGQTPLMLAEVNEHRRIATALRAAHRTFLATGSFACRFTNKTRSKER